MKTSERTVQSMLMGVMLTAIVILPASVSVAQNRHKTVNTIVIAARSRCL